VEELFAVADGVAGVIAAAMLLTGASGAALFAQSQLPFITACVFPLFCAVLAAVFGPWLRRYYPFSQSLLFGAIALAAVTVLLAIASVVARIVREPCPPATLCAGPFDGVFWVLVFYGFPAFLGACIGFGLAIWSPTRRGRRAFWWLLAGATAVFAVTLRAYGS